MFFYVLTGIPKILREDLRFVIQRHGSVNITVPFYSYPYATNITFVRGDGTILGNKDTPKLYVTDGSVETQFYGQTVILDGQHAVLALENLKEEDFTNYTIIISNDVGVIEALLDLVGESRFLEIYWHMEN